MPNIFDKLTDNTASSFSLDNGKKYNKRSDQTVAVYDINNSGGGTGGGGYTSGTAIDFGSQTALAAFYNIPAGVSSVKIVMEGLGWHAQNVFMFIGDSNGFVFGNSYNNNSFWTIESSSNLNNLDLTGTISLESIDGYTWLVQANLDGGRLVDGSVWINAGHKTLSGPLDRFMIGSGHSLHTAYAPHRGFANIHYI
jgi:hypothetical protein